MSLREFREHIKTACDWCADQDDVKAFEVSTSNHIDGFSVKIEWAFGDYISVATFSRYGLTTAMPAKMIEGRLCAQANKARENKADQ